VVTSSKEGNCGGQVSGSDMSLLHTPTESIFPQMPELLAQRIGAQNGNIHLASSSAAIRIFCVSGEQNESMLCLLLHKSNFNLEPS
jgi:hypothetical protein